MVERLNQHIQIIKSEDNYQFKVSPKQCLSNNSVLLGSRTINNEESTIMKRKTSQHKIEVLKSYEGAFFIKEMIALSIFLKLISQRMYHWKSKEQPAALTSFKI